jgi:hypothetical protein
LALWLSRDYSCRRHAKLTQEKYYRVVLVNFQNYDDGRCDGCGRRTSIAEVARTEVSRELDSATVASASWR